MHSWSYSGSKPHVALPLCETALKERPQKMASKKPCYHGKTIHFCRIQLESVWNTVPLTLCLQKQKNKPTILIYLHLLSSVRIVFRQTRGVNETKVINIWIQTLWCSNTPYQFSVMQARSRISMVFSWSVLKSMSSWCFTKSYTMHSNHFCKTVNQACLAAPGLYDHVFIPSFDEKHCLPDHSYEQNKYLNL